MIRLAKNIFLLTCAFLMSPSAQAQEMPCYLMDGSPYFIQLEENYEENFNPLQTRIGFKIIVSDFIDQVRGCGDQKIAQQIIKNKDNFSVSKISVNGKDVGLLNLKKENGKFSFDLPLNKGFNLVELSIDDNFGMPMELANGANYLRLWSGNSELKVKVKDEKNAAVEGASVELLLKLNNQNVRKVTKTDDSGMAIFKNIPEYDSYIRQGMIFILAQKDSLLGNSVVEKENDIKVTMRGIGEPTHKLVNGKLEELEQPENKRMKIEESDSKNDDTKCNMCNLVKEIKIEKKPALPKSMMGGKKVKR
jgi:hypothetical protein